jgi:hypothetical protein
MYGFPSSAGLGLTLSDGRVSNYQYQNSNTDQITSLALRVQVYCGACSHTLTMEVQVSKVSTVEAVGQGCSRQKVLSRVQSTVSVTVMMT